MLCRSLLTYGVKFEQSGVGSPHCRLCDLPFDPVTHLVSTCSTFNDVREQILIEIDEKLKASKNCLRLSNVMFFILDYLYCCFLALYRSVDRDVFKWEMKLEKLDYPTIGLTEYMSS